MVRPSTFASLKLTVEPVPTTTAGKSLSTLLPKHRWDSIRKRVYAEHEQRCAVCGTERGKRRLHCHEEWEYDDASGVQRLKGLVALCYLCHAVKHKTVWFVPYGPYGYISPEEAELGARLSNVLKGIAWLREHELRERFVKEEAAKPPGDQRFWSDDPERWPGRYRRELEERGDEETLRWLDDLDRQHPNKLVEHFVEVNNGVSLAVLEEHILKAKETWMERSRREWRVDFGEFY